MPVTLTGNFLRRRTDIDNDSNKRKTSFHESSCEQKFTNLELWLEKVFVPRLLFLIPLLLQLPLLSRNISLMPNRSR